MSAMATLRPSDFPEGDRGLYSRWGLLVLVSVPWEPRFLEGTESGMVMVRYLAPLDADTSLKEPFP